MKIAIIARFIITIVVVIQCMLIVSQEAGDLTMKTVKGILLTGLFAGLALFVEAYSQSFLHFGLERIEILPAAPSPTDDVQIRITGWIPTPCDPDVSFSDLQRSREGDQITFWATAMTQVPEPTICIQLAVPVFHSYQVGKLEPGNYDFVLYACIGENDVCESAKTVLARRSFTVASLPCIPFSFDLNKNRKLDDSEIILAIDIWVRGADVPNCPSSPQKLSDVVLIELIDLWIRQDEITSLFPLED